MNCEQFQYVVRAVRVIFGIQCAEKHLQRYLSEFDFRYNDRIALGVDGVARTELVGKRLTYPRRGIRTVAQPKAKQKGRIRAFAKIVPPGHRPKPR